MKVYSTFTGLISEKRTSQKNYSQEVDLTISNWHTEGVVWKFLFIQKKINLTFANPHQEIIKEYLTFNSFHF